MANPRYAVNDQTGEVMKNDGSGWSRVRSARNDAGDVLIYENDAWGPVPSGAAQQTSGASDMQRQQNPQLAAIQDAALSGSRDDLVSANQAGLNSEAERVRQIRRGESAAGRERLVTAMNGATFGLLDEAYGLMGERGRQMRDVYRQDLVRAREDRPGESLGLEVIGGALSGGGLASAGRAAGVKMGAGTAGAVAGGVYGAGDANGNAFNRVTGAATGAALGVAGGKLAEGAGRLFNAFSRGVRGDTQPLNPSNEFGIRLTQGQQADDAAQIAFEQAAARGGRGGEAQQVMRPFMEDQRGSVVAAGRNLAGDTYDTMNEAGSAFVGGVRRAADRARNEIDTAYDAARGYNAKMRASGVSQLGQAVEEAVPEDIRFLMDASPEEARAQFPSTVSAINSAKRLMGEITAKSDGAAEVTALDFRRIELARRAINRSIEGATNRADQAGAIAAKRGFDDFLDNAVDQGLFEGDPNFLPAYQNARQLRADYGRNFEANKVIETIIDNPENEVQIINKMLGGKSTAGANATRIIPQLRQALGPDSEEFGALREAAVKRLMKQTERTFNPKVLADNLKNATDGDMAPVFRQLMEPEELDAMRQLETVVRRIIPPEGSVNTSNTAYELKRALMGPLDRVPGMNILRAALQKYLPDTNAQRARSAVSTSGTLRSQPNAFAAGVYGGTGAIAGGEPRNALANALGFEARPNAVIERRP